MRSVDEELTELVFEGMDEAKALGLVADILARPLSPPSCEQVLEDVEVPVLDVGGRVALRDVHVRLLRYDGDVYDVEINFIPASAAGTNPFVMRAVHDYANGLGTKHAVTRYFAGMEPASDEDTRYFTGTEIGPYMSI